MLPKKLSNTSSSTPNGATKKTASGLRVIVGGLLQAGVILGVLALLLAWWRNDTVGVRVGAAYVQAKLADTADERRHGLAGTTHLGPAQGMLFVFGYDAPWEMWMEGMQVPVDIVWLDATKKVVRVQAAVQPETYPHRFTPGMPTRYVLELASGVAAKYHIEPGVRANFDVPSTTK